MERPGLSRTGLSRSRPVKNHGGGGAREPGRIARERRTKENKEKQRNHKGRHWERDKQYCPCFFGENVAGRTPSTFSQKHGFGCLGIQVFRCSGVQGVQGVLGVLGCLGCFRGVQGVKGLGLMTFWKVKKVTREGGPKMAQFNME